MMRDYFSGCEFWWGDQGGVYSLVSTASAALYIHCSAYILAAVLRTCFNPLHIIPSTFHFEAALLIRLHYPPPKKNSTSWLAHS